MPAVFRVDIGELLVAAVARKLHPLSGEPSPAARVMRFRGEPSQSPKSHARFRPCGRDGGECGRVEERTGAFKLHQIVNLPIESGLRNVEHVIMYHIHGAGNLAGALRQVLHDLAQELRCLCYYLQTFGVRAVRSRARLEGFHFG